MSTSAFLVEDFQRLRENADEKFPVKMPYKPSLSTERWLTENFGPPFVSLFKDDSGDQRIRINADAKWDWRRDTLYLSDDDRMHVFVTLYLKGR